MKTLKIPYSNFYGEGKEAQFHEASEQLASDGFDWYHSEVNNNIFTMYDDKYNIIHQFEISYDEFDNMLLEQL